MKEDLVYVEIVVESVKSNTFQSRDQRPLQ